MFRLFGFPVKINAGFVIFVGLIAMIYQNRFGLILAATLAIFTLIHELGHAIVARHYGANAAISLGFMAGYTSYSSSPGVNITPMRRAAISLAGPVVQIVASSLVLAAMGVSPLARPSYGKGDIALATWWAGPVIGVLNLIPVLPLDGGHLVQNVLTSVLKRSVFKPMAYFSLGLTAAFAIYLNVTGRRNFVVFIAFLLYSQFSIVQAVSSKPSSAAATRSPGNTRADTAPSQPPPSWDAIPSQTIQPTTTQPETTHPPAFKPVANAPDPTTASGSATLPPPTPPINSPNSRG